MLCAVLRRFERALFVHGPDLEYLILFGFVEFGQISAGTSWLSQGHRVALSFVKLGKTCLPTMSRYHWVAGSSWIDSGFSMSLLRPTKVKKFFEVVSGFLESFVC